MLGPKENPARAVDYVYNPDQTTVSGFSDGNQSCFNPGGESRELLIMSIT